MNFRFSGHGTFPCRYTWLPKAVRNLKVLGDDDAAMVELGVGKNMVRSIRFWVEATGIASRASNRGSELCLTPIGKALLSAGGYDEYFEDVQTLWLIHWQLATHVDEPLFAWQYLLNHWHRAEFTRSEVLSAFFKETQKEEKPLSPVTLEEHFTVFLHTYIRSRSSKREVVEDSLDCPLVDLEFIQEVGERPTEGGRRERIYAFRTEEKPEISSDLFTFCLMDYWKKQRIPGRTVSFGQIAVSEGSPGQVFKLPEQAIRERLETVGRDSHGVFTFDDSTTSAKLIKQRDESLDVLLKRVYGKR